MHIIETIFNIYHVLRANIKAGENLKLYGLVRMYAQNNGKIIIGRNCTIVSSAKNNPVGGGKKTILCAKNGGLITIGDNVGISNAEIVSLCSIIIENNVLIGGGTVILDSDHHSQNYVERMENDKESIKCKPVIIKEGAFIGAHCLILKGVTIGKHGIVGAGSVVTKTIPDNEIWAGNPAKKIGQIE